MKAKIEPTQKVLGALYDQTDRVMDLMICMQNACYGVRVTAGSGVDEEIDGLVEGMRVTADHLRKVKDVIHDLVEWA